MIHQLMTEPNNFGSTIDILPKLGGFYIHILPEDPLRFLVKY